MNDNLTILVCYALGLSHELNLECNISHLPADNVKFRFYKNDRSVAIRFDLEESASIDLSILCERLIGVVTQFIEEVSSCAIHNVKEE